MADRSKIDTGHAMQAAARLDHLLLVLLLTRLDKPEMSESRAKEELGTFGLRRRLAHELSLIDDATNADLKTVNEIRAVFAHAELPITFRSKYVLKEAEAFREWKAGVSARRLFDKAVASAEAAIKARTDELRFQQATKG